MNGKPAQATFNFATETERDQFMSSTANVGGVSVAPS